MSSQWISRNPPIQLLPPIHSTNSSISSNSPSLEVFENRDLLYEYLSKLDYSSIRRTCSLNKEIYLMCSIDEQIGDLIRKRKKQIELRTDLFEKKRDKFYEASKLGDVEVVDELIKRGYDPSSVGNWAIRTAVDYEHLAVVDRLLQDGRVDPSVYDNETLMVAIIKRNLRIVNRLLQDRRVDPTSQDNFVIEIASDHNDLQIVRRLLQDIRVRKSLSPARLQKYVAQVGYIFSPLSPPSQEVFSNRDLFYKYLSKMDKYS